jgi:2-iminobutanoate/2-iminopropanoate deaminase
MTAREVIGIDPVEPYSKAVRGAGLVFVKSQVGPDPSTGEYPAGIAEQTRNTLAHLEHALELAGSSLARAVKVNVYLSDIDRDFDRMDQAYLGFFSERGVAERPARTTIGVPLSWPELLVQMDMVAVG